MTVLSSLSTLRSSLNTLPSVSDFLNTGPKKFPKVDSPFVRETADNGRSLATPEIKNGYEWVFDDDTIAIEKLDGTNCAVKIENGTVVEAYTRLGNREMQPVSPYGDRDQHFVVNGIQNSVNRDYLKRLDDGIHFGELIGPAFGGGTSEVKNPHDVEEYLFIPFQRAVRKLQYRSWNEYEQDYDSIRTWFDEGLFSLFYCQWNGCSSDESYNNGYCEGIIVAKQGFEFDGTLETETRTYENEDGTTETIEVATNLAKIRRDMFPEYWE